MVVGEDEAIKTFSNGGLHQLGSADLAAGGMFSGMGVQLQKQGRTS
jgi:hypothetical protein